MAPTEALYLHDSYLQTFTAQVLEFADSAVVLDRSAFYPTGGGQPHDTGVMTVTTDSGGTETSFEVTAVRKDGNRIVHTVVPGQGSPADSLDMMTPGTEVTGRIDWQRRHALMRTHTVLHILCGVIWNEWAVPVTGGNMEPLSARMDFEFDPLPDGFATRIAELVNEEIAADRPIEVSFLPRTAAVTDPDLIRTKVNLIPESVQEIRVVDIVGLDKQADGGTHVASTRECGVFSVLKTESKGKGNKRVRMALSDA